MLIKGMVLFLVVMAVLAMFGRLRLPGTPKRPPGRGATRCLACGRPKIGPGACPCKTKES